MRFTAPLLAGIVAIATLGFSGEAEARHNCYSKSHRNHSSCTKTYQKRSYSKTYQKRSYPNRSYSAYKSHRYNRPKYGPVVVVTTPRAKVTYRSGYSYGYGYGYTQPCRSQYRHYRTSYVPAPSYAYHDPQVKRRNRVESQLELGLRGVAGGTEGSFETVAGLGAYTRLRNGHLGLEASIDSTAVSTADGSLTYGRVPVLGAALLYLNPRSPIRLYGLLGGGITFHQTGSATSETLTFQGGAGVDFDLSPRTSLSLDVRTLTDVEDDATRILPAGPELPAAFVTGNLGISVKF